MLRLFVALYMVFVTGAFAEAHQKICLNMIVKDESSVIRRCLESVKPLIDYWVIVDTGSTDPTQQIIRQTLKGIPGELHERPWKNFAHNRNEALSLAKGKGDYVLFIDADEVLVVPKGFHFPHLSEDCYDMDVVVEEEGCEQSRHRRNLLINNAIQWEWQGVLHETIKSRQATGRVGLFDHVYVIARNEGARSKDPDKHLKDAQLLEEGLRQEPGNLRYRFYLAVSYNNAGLYEQALQHFQKRIAEDTEFENENEILISLMFIGALQAALDKENSVVIDGLTRAALFDPSRAEALYFLGKYFLRKNNPLLAELVIKRGLEIPKPDSSKGFVIAWIYDWGLLGLYAKSLVEQNRFSEAKAVLGSLLKKDLPKTKRDQFYEQFMKG